MNRTTFLLLFCFHTLFAYAGVPISHYAANAYRFNKEYPQEKVYLHFDNTSYMTGDTVWFKAYVVNASDFTAAKSQVLYVDLLSAAGGKIRQHKFRIVDGQADGYICLTNVNTDIGREKRGEIVANLQSGYYEIRAYTAYMLNFQDAAIFSRVFPVMEIRKDDTTGAGVRDLPAYNQFKIQERPIMTKTHDMDVSFYPEGGSMIIGKPCRVAFKVTGKNGLGLNATGVLEGVLDGVVDDSLHISTVHDGMGSFLFTPSGNSSRVKFETADGISGTFDLPEAIQYGHTLNIIEQTADSLKLKVISSTGPENMQDSLGLAIMCRGRLMHFSQIPVYQEHSESILEVALSGIPEGVCQICLYDSIGNPVSTRMFYHRSRQDIPQIEVHFDKTGYHPLDKVRLDVDLTYKGQPFSDNICLSVRDDDCHQGGYYNDLRTDLLLSSDLRGLVWKPEYYYECDDAEHNEALDLLCMVQGWERYDWRQMAGVVEFKEKKRLENGLTYNAWIKDRESGLGIDGIPMNVSYMLPDSSVTQLKMLTEQGGYMGLDIPDFYGDAELYLWPDRKGESRKARKNSEVFIDNLKPSIRQLLPQEMEELRKHVANMDNPDDSTSALPQVININNGILLPEVDIREKRPFVDYATFHDFDIRREREGYDKMDVTLSEFMANQGYDLHNLEPLLVLFRPVPFPPDKTQVRSPYATKMSEVENVILFDEPMDFWTYTYIDFIVWNNNEYVSEVEWVSPDWLTAVHHNEKFTFCIVYLEDKKSKVIDTYNLDNIHQVRLPLHGYTQPAQFYSPQYPDGPQYYDVDYRRTLYWNPNLQTDKDGHARIEFYNNSYSTKFKASASGLNGGVPYSMDK